MPIRSKLTTVRGSRTGQYAKWRPGWHFLLSIYSLLDLSFFMQKPITLAFILALLCPANAFADDHPTALSVLEEQGVRVIHEFDSALGLRGYIGEAEGQILTFYSSDDGRHLILGDLIGPGGTSLSEQTVQEKVYGPRLESAWPMIEQSHWVQDGSSDAELILYTFTDPNCPYCARFRQQVAPWIESNDIQLRHIMVGILAEDSLAKSAMILKSPSPQTLLKQQQDTIMTGGIDIDRTLMSEGYMAVKANNNLMGDLGFGGTPITVYRDGDGDIQTLQGILDQNKLNQLAEEGF